jgi:hypothetical protein
MMNRWMVVIAVSLVGFAALLGGGADRKISPENIYANNGQKDVKKLPDAVTPGDLQKVHGEAKDRKPAVFLVAAKDIAAAVKASRGLAVQRAAGDPVPEVKTGAKGTLWVGAYLGSSGSSPPQFLIESVEVTTKTIRVAYQRANSKMVTADLREYLLWAPLGELKAGDLTLELYEVTSKKVTLKQSWKVAVE